MQLSQDIPPHSMYRLAELAKSSFASVAIAHFMLLVSSNDCWIQVKSYIF